MSSNNVTDNTVKVTEWKDSGSEFLYYIFMIIISGLILGILMANCIYYDKLMKKPTPDISTNQATIMLWLNAIMAGLAGVIFIWSIVMIISMRSKTVRDVVTVGKNTADDVYSTMKESADVVGRDAFIAMQPKYKKIDGFIYEKQGDNYVLKDNKVTGSNTATRSSIHVTDRAAVAASRVSAKTVGGY